MKIPYGFWDDVTKSVLISEQLSMSTFICPKLIRIGELYNIEREMLANSVAKIAAEQICSKFNLTNEQDLHDVIVVLLTSHGIYSAIKSFVEDVDCRNKLTYEIRQAVLLELRNRFPEMGKMQTCYETFKRRIKSSIRC